MLGVKNFFVVAATQPQFVTDFLKLCNDGTTWLLVISSAVAVFFAMWFAMKWYKAEENEKPQALKKVKDVVIGAVAVLIMESVLKLVLSYFTH